VIICSIIYHIIINPFEIISIIITVAYAFIYNKWLSQKLNISNEKVQRLENSCLIKKIKEKIATFISLEDTQSKDKKQQPLVNYQQDINNSVNMSFIPANMYPNYYSGIIAAPGQQQIQLQQFAPSQGINNPPVIDINQPN
jgi:predicted small secreted protein